MTEDLVIVGAGFAGLCAAHHARRRGLDPLVLDRAEGPGGMWRRADPAMRCLSPRALDRLPDGRVPAGPGPIATGAEVRALLEQFASEQRFRSRFGVAVRGVERTPTGLALRLPDELLPTRRVVVASGVAGAPRPPPPGASDWIPALDLHTRRAGVGARALVIGAGNSGADAVETLLGWGVQVVLSSRRPLASQGPYPTGLSGALRWRLSGLPARWLPPALRCRGPVLPVDNRLQRAVAAGRVTLVGETLAVDEHGATCAVAPGASQTTAVVADTVVLAHGYDRDLRWLGPLAQTPHQQGVLPTGDIALLGLPCQRTRRSGFLRGMNDDAGAALDRLLAGA